MLEIRFHGRGGQGAVMAATILGKAVALYEGKYALSFPAFGTERRGAPVMAFTRIDDKPIRLRTQVYKPNVVVVLDDSLLATTNVVEGLASDGLVLVNTVMPAEEMGLQAGPSAKVVTIDATGIALKTLKVNIVNTSILGALCAVSGLVKIDSIIKSIENTLPERLVKRNVEAAQEAYRALSEGRTAQ
ncbi:pyruvate ferredoxin oxidoreductase subunit gamma [Moorella naiadis]|uniref:pyruvate ferredoxin oxidoreductase subunit gamma n=1 Tax=Moorella naiadis (nom. illeg.) TaxID=3093670 RepID=UPI003D9C816E